MFILSYSSNAYIEFYFNFISIVKNYFEYFKFYLLIAT